MTQTHSSFIKKELGWLIHPATKEIRRTNLQRMFFSSILMAIVHIVFVVSFYYYSPPQDQVHTILWQQWAIYGHVFMFFIVIATGLTTYQLYKKGNVESVLSHLLPLTACILYLLFGIYITTIEQPIYPTIAPFLLTTVGVGGLLLIRPVFSLLTFSIAYFIFFDVVELTQMNSDLLISIQLNGLTAVILGFGISLLNWRNHVILAKQNKFIQVQNKKLERKNQKLIHMSTYDALTGLYNRMKFMSLIGTEMKKMKRFSHDGCLIILDIDNFKNINDQYGHPVGDLMLQKIGRIISKNVSDNDIAARLGGEEFMIFLPRVSVDEGKELAETLRLGIESFSLENKGEEVHVTASFGLAPIIPTMEDPFHISYCAADEALYQAKEAGRNRIKVSNNIMAATQEDVPRA
ncbi:GGDEF domain-containing protein [Litchfieldia alkalitelluris]|nr:GGDEF domain-containing protein [Litchfieldia alkalitelluris]